MLFNFEKQINNSVLSRLENCVKDKKWTDIDKEDFIKIMHLVRLSIVNQNILCLFNQKDDYNKDTCKCATCSIINDIMKRNK